MSPAIVAMYLVRVGSDVLGAHVAEITVPETPIPSRPPIIRELRIRVVQREAAAGAHKMAGFGELPHERV